MGICSDCEECFPGINSRIRNQTILSELIWNIFTHETSALFPFLIIILILQTLLAAIITLNNFTRTVDWSRDEWNFEIFQIKILARVRDGERMRNYTINLILIFDFTTLGVGRSRASSTYPEQPIVKWSERIYECETRWMGKKCLKYSRIIQMKCSNCATRYDILSETRMAAPSDDLSNGKSIFLPSDADNPSEYQHNQLSPWFMITNCEIRSEHNPFTTCVVVISLLFFWQQKTFFCALSHPCHQSLFMLHIHILCTTFACDYINY